MRGPANNRLEERLEDRYYRQTVEGRGQDFREGGHLPIERERMGQEQRAMMATLRRCTEVLDWQGAVDMLQHIPSSPGPEWVPVYRSILNCCCRALKYEEAMRVWKLLPVKDTVSYNTVLGLCSRLHRFAEMESLLQQMDDERVQRSTVTFGQVINSCAESRRWTVALDCLEELKALGKDADPTPNWAAAYVSAMTACARSGEKAIAEALLESMQSSGLAKPDNSHYNALIVACHTDGKAADEIFNKMKNAGLKPRPADWRVLISVHRLCKDQQARYLEMKAELPPDVPREEIWAVMLKNAANLQDQAGMDFVYQEMREAGQNPEVPEACTSPSLRRALMWCTRRVEAQEKAREESRRMRRPRTSSWSPEEDSPRATLTPPASPPAEEKRIPLPPNWGTAVDPNTGMSYYWRLDNPAGTTTWERPSLP